MPGTFTGSRSLTSKPLLASQEPGERNRAHTLLRQLVERIVVRPTVPYGPVEFDIYGQLAGLFQLSDPVPATKSMGAMVAGERNQRFFASFAIRIPTVSVSKARV